MHAAASSWRRRLDTTSGFALDTYYVGTGEATRRAIRPRWCLNAPSAQLRPQVLCNAGALGSSCARDGCRTRSAARLRDRCYDLTPCSTACSRKPVVNLGLSNIATFDQSTSGTRSICTCHVQQAMTAVPLPGLSLIPPPSNTCSPVNASGVSNARTLGVVGSLWRAPCRRGIKRDIRPF
ncbi:hypothetical protein FKP32DRAFT_393368 [Trametes sanguinea]|nr:hypothetical protein FKP32DRAFT_393368 [Trametes sanguinea]